MAKNKVTLTFAGDSKDLERATNRVGRALDDVDDKAKRSGGLLDKFGDTGGEAARSFGLRFQERVGPLVANAPVSGPLVAVVAAAAPAAAAALSSGILLGLGGGVLAAGILGAIKDPRVAGAFTQLKTRATTALAGFSEPFKGPLIRAADTFGDALERMAPALKRMGVAIAPIIDKMAPAFAQMAEKAMPGIEKAVKASVPLFEKIAEHAPAIGQAISEFFEFIAKGAPSAVKFLDILLKGVEFVFPAVGRALALLTGWFLVTIDTLKVYGRYFVATWNRIKDSAGLATRIIKAAWAGLVNYIKNVPRSIIATFRAIGAGIVAPFRSAFNGIAWAWNSTIGRLSWTVPSWVPFMGGNSINVPNIPTLHRGGVVPGAPGSEVLAILQAGERVTPVGASSSALSLEIRSGGSRLDDLLVEILAGAIRARGGNVQKILGTSRG